MSAVHTNHDDTDGLGSTHRVRPSRRALLGASAWTVPAVVTVGSVPAFGAVVSGVPVITATFNSDSFRASTNANLNSGTPTSAGTLSALAMTVNVAGGRVDAVKCEVATSGNGVTFQNNMSTPARGSTTWSSQQADFKAGWSSSPTIPQGADTTAYIFTSAASVSGALVLKIVLGNTANTDYDMTFTFSSTGVSSRSVVTVSSSAASPYVTGAVLNSA